MTALKDFFDILAGLFYSLGFYMLKLLIPSLIIYYFIRMATKEQIRKELEKYELKKQTEGEKNK